jgi:branched-chain amino acid transport system substrate-binding protein
MKNKSILLSVLVVLSLLISTFSVGAIDPGETIKIGVVCPISGSAAIAGKYIINGVKLLDEEIKAAGGVERDGVFYPVEFIFEDNEAKEDITANAYQKLIYQDDVLAILGPDMSKTILAAGPIAQAAGVPNVGTFPTNTAVTEIGDYIFRACFIDPFQGQAAATYAWEAGYKTAGVLFNNADAYSKGLYEFFKLTFESLGGKVVEAQAYSGSDVKDYNVQLTKINAANPDCIFMPNLLSEVGLQIQQARSIGITAPLIGGDSWDTPEVTQIAGPKNIEGSVYVAAFSAENPDPIAQDFVNRFKEAFNGDLPNSNATLAYEAGKMIVEGIVNSETLDRAGVRDAIAQIKDLQLPSGTLTVGPDRNPIKGASVMRYDENGISRFLTIVNP